MPREIITINVGQCGNQLGSEFFKRICKEHGIEADGSLATQQDFHDRKDIFFYQSDDQRYIPRSINIDMEPRVLESIKANGWNNFYNPENFIIPSTNGAGNQWVNGYFIGEKMSQIEEVIDREVEHCDNLESFFICHSITGGTGSGLGSRIIEFLSDKYPKSIIQSFAVATSQSESDVVVAPYNSILTMKRLITECNSVVLFDNQSLSNIASTQLGIEEASMSDMNSIIAASMSSFTAGLRFPSTIYNGLNSYLIHLCPSKFSHFLSTSYTPFRNVNRSTSQTNAIDVMKRLIQQQNMMSPTNLKEGKFISMCDFFQGNITTDEINDALQRFSDKKIATFVDNNQDPMKIINSRNSPLIQQHNRVTGMMLANHTGVKSFFNTLVTKFNSLYQKKAYIDQYIESFGNNTQEFDESKEIVNCVKEEYESLESNGFDNYTYPIHDHLHGLALSKRMNEL